MNRRIASLISAQQAARRMMAWMVSARQLRRDLKGEAVLPLYPLKEIFGTRAWSQTDKGKEREGA